MPEQYSTNQEQGKDLLRPLLPPWHPSHGFSKFLQRLLPQFLEGGDGTVCEALFQGIIVNPLLRPFLVPHGRPDDRFIIPPPGFIVRSSQGGTFHPFPASQPLQGFVEFILGKKLIGLAIIQRTVEVSPQTADE